MLVVRPVQARRDDGPVRRLSHVGGSAGGDDAGELHLVLDRRVGVQVPEEPVIVVPDRGQRRDHQPAAAADLDRSVQVLGVLPADAGVFLVDADRVGPPDRLAVVVVHDRLHVADLAQATAAHPPPLPHPPPPPLPPPPPPALPLQAGGGVPIGGGDDILYRAGERVGGL